MPMPWQWEATRSLRDLSIRPLGSEDQLHESPGVPGVGAPLFPEAGGEHPLFGDDALGVGRDQQCRHYKSRDQQAPAAEPTQAGRLLAYPGWRRTRYGPVVIGARRSSVPSVRV